MAALSALLAALAVLIGMRRDPSARIPRPGRPRRQLGVPAAAALSALAAALLLGWPLGLPAALLLALGVPFAASRLESAQARRAREQLERQGP